MDRRDFLKRLLGTAAGVALASTYDLEKLLWMPKPMIVVPALRKRLTLDEINAVVMKQIWPGISDSFFMADPLIKRLRERGLSA